MCHACHTLHHHHTFLHPTYRILSAYHVLLYRNKQKEMKTLVTLRHVRERHTQEQKMRATYAGCLNTHFILYFLSSINSVSSCTQTELVGEWNSFHVHSRVLFSLWKLNFYYFFEKSVNQKFYFKFFLQVFLHFGLRKKIFLK